MRLSSFIKNNALLQASRAFSIRGEDTSGGKISSFLRKANSNEIIEATKIALERSTGEFVLSFPPIEGSFDPFILYVSDGKETLEIQPLYFGDVYLFVGQSNLSLPLRYIENKDDYVKAIESARLNFLLIGEREITSEGYIHRPSSPQNDIDKSFFWELGNQDNILGYSALAVMTLVKLAPHFPYPLGAIMTAVGGISIDSLLPTESVEKDGPIKEYLIKTGKFIGDHSKFNTFGAADYTQQAGLFNEKIAPFKGLSFKGVVFYQGENSAFDFSSGVYFKHALEELISSYRKYFSDPDLPFLISGLADEFYPYGDSYGLGYIQEVLSSFKDKNVSYVPIYDVEPRWLVNDSTSVYHPIHTVNKEEVAKRYASVIETNICSKGSFHYPYVKNIVCSGSSLFLDIDLIGRGFAVDSCLEGFTIAGEDGVYRSCLAKAVKPNLIELKSNEVKAPRHYCYGLNPYSYLACSKTVDGYPLIESRSQIEPFSSSLYLDNWMVSSCDRLSLTENNFGASVGGGFPVPLFSQGEIVRGKVTLSIDHKIKSGGQGSVCVEASPDESSYWYFGVKVLLSPCGCPHHLEHFPFLSIDLCGEAGIEFCGALFRSGGFIYRLPLIDASKSRLGTSPLHDKWNTYSLDLRTKEDGSEAPSPIDPGMIGTLSYLEFYFRSMDKPSRKIWISNIRGSFDPPSQPNAKTITNEEITSLILPKGTSK